MSLDAGLAALASEGEWAIREDVLMVHATDLGRQHYLGDTFRDVFPPPVTGTPSGAPEQDVDPG